MVHARFYPFIIKYFELSCNSIFRSLSLSLSLSLWMLLLLLLEYSCLFFFLDRILVLVNEKKWPRLLLLFFAYLPFFTIITYNTHTDLSSWGFGVKSLVLSLRGVYRVWMSMPCSKVGSTHTVYHIHTYTHSNLWPTFHSYIYHCFTSFCFHSWRPLVFLCVYINIYICVCVCDEPLIQ